MQTKSQFASPYLQAGRLQDLMTALQLMGSHDTWRRPISDEDGSKKEVSWDRMLGSPLSVEGQESSWSNVFPEHPEFFRIDKHNHASLVWRRGLAKDGDDKQRPPLSETTIARLIEFAISLHSAAIADRDVVAERTINQQQWLDERQANQDRWDAERRLNRQYRDEERSANRSRLIASVLASIGAALIAFFAAIQSAAIQVGAP